MREELNAVLFPLIQLPKSYAVHAAVAPAAADAAHLPEHVVHPNVPEARRRRSQLLGYDYREAGRRRGVPALGLDDELPSRSPGSPAGARSGPRGSPRMSRRGLPAPSPLKGRRRHYPPRHRGRDRDRPSSEAGEGAGREAAQAGARDGVEEGPEDDAAFAVVVSRCPIVAIARVDQLSEAPRFRREHARAAVQYTQRKRRPALFLGVLARKLLKEARIVVVALAICRAGDGVNGEGQA
ncbi:uncharacterized protein PG986_001187 [Apiospora aurea]|uniref:Uncharacterized protein n=1 Tax=Apiospora aurea TaxID=335848 RepID=A0ABR1QW55_9PEZI